MEGSSPGGVILPVGRGPGRAAGPKSPMKTSLLQMSAVALVCLVGTRPAAASSASLVTSVYSEVRNGYARQKLPDGSFKREYYAITNGVYSPGRDKDRSIDGVRFPDLAGMVAQVLARRNYYFAPDAKSADLLLVIHWGTTIPFRDAQYGNAAINLVDSANSFRLADTVAHTPNDRITRDRGGIQSPEMTVRQVALEQLQGDLYTMLMFEGARRDADTYNAQLLGYVKEINDRDNLSREAGAGLAYDDLVSDIEAPRYYVVIAAYDFRAATQLKEQKLLWVTRVSIQAQGNRFNERLKDMLASACRYLGQDSGHLIRQYHQGEVSFGDLKVLGYEPAPAPAEKPEEKR